MSNSGYTECVCCSDIIVVDDISALSVCRACARAECSDGAGCLILACAECGESASLMNDDRWHPNCDDSCARAQKAGNQSW